MSGLSRDVGQRGGTTFAALWTSTKANDWQLPTTILPSANFTTIAANPPGQYYRPLGMDQLWDDYP